MKPLLEYIKRIGKSRGFGIQSPWAYSFVRDVIFESLDYYAYAEIENSYSDYRERKWQKLFFRLKNFSHGHRFRLAELSSLTDIEIRDFMKEGTLLVLRVKDKEYCNVERIKAMDDVGITFDLYNCLICFPPSEERTKQDYKLNF